MGNAWKQFDLEGGGLQSANLALSRRLKRRRIAYGLWLVFPLGLHRFYLDDKRFAWAYPSVSLVALLAFAVIGRNTALAVLALLTVGALYDLYWIDRRITDLNKRIRMSVYLRPGSGAPAEFHGRFSNEDELADYARDKEQERAGHGHSAPARDRPSRSFAEQEALLRELAQRKKRRD